MRAPAPRATASNVMTFALVLVALAGALSLGGCQATLGRSYLGVRSGDTRYSISFVGSSGKLSATGSATIHQLGVTLTDSGWTEETETTSNLPRAVARETVATGTTRASSGLEWKIDGDRDSVVQFALKRVFRLIDFRPEDSGAATIEVHAQHEPTSEERSASYVILFKSESRRLALVELTLQPDVGLAAARAITDAGEWKLHVELAPPG